MAPQPLSPTPPAQPEPRQDYSSLLGTFRAIAMILAVRVILLLSVLGGLGLAIGAMRAATESALYVLIAYALLVIAPMVALDWRKGPKT